MKIKGVIFDLDGTLLDSMGIWEHIAEDYLLSLGITPKEDLSETFKDMSFEQSAKYYQDHYNVNKSVEDIMNDIHKMVEDYYFYDVSLKDGVKEFLDYLYKNNIKMCIGTATHRYLVEAALARLNVSNVFDFIITCYEVGQGKDQPIIYQKALELLNTPKEETFIFEDALYAIITAKKAGFHVVGVYDKYEKNQDEVKRISDKYIKNYKRVEDII